MDFRIKKIAIIALFAFCLKSAQSQSLIFQKPITLQKKWCGGVNNTCASVSGYSYPNSDTVPQGKVWKIEYICQSGDLKPHVYINNEEINSWESSSRGDIWKSNQPIWLNEGEILSTGASDNNIWNRNAFGIITINLIEFSKQ